MPETNVGFIYTFSTEATKKILNGEIPLSVGGTRPEKGRILEMCKPLSLESGMIDFNEFRSNSQQAKEGLDEANAKLDSLSGNNQIALNRIIAANATLDLVSSKLVGLEDVAWLNYAATNRLYQMGYEGFSQMLKGIGLVSSQVDRLNRRFDEKEEGDNFQKMHQCAQDLKSLAGIMETESFSARSSYFDATKIINDVFSFLIRLFRDVKRGTGNDEVSIKSIISLFMPYCYVIFRYSILFYYEARELPPNYYDWVKIVERITKDARFKNRFEYYLRVNSDLPLTKAISLEKRILLNYHSIVSDMEVYKEYALSHSMEEYFSIEDRLLEKIGQRDFSLYNGHMTIMLP